MRLLRVRFTVRRMLTGVVVIAIGLSLLRIARLTITAIGDGVVDVPLVFLVVDESTAYPIESASIRVLDHLGPRIQGHLVATTGQDGRAKIVLDTMFSE